MTNPPVQEDGYAKGPMPRKMLIIPCVYVAFLIAAVAVWGYIASFNVMGQVPIILVWTGMLGGVLASLQGIFINNKKWDHSYDYWHAFSGLIGAAYAIVSYFFLIAIIKVPSPVSQPDILPTYVLAAFLLSYGQRQFHSLMNTAFDLIFRPVSKTTELTKGSIDMTLSVTSSDAEVKSIKK